MASPHATGVAALVTGKNPSLSPDQVREILRSSSDDRGPAGWDPLYGYGRVNALQAVTATP
jgi:subtilisin family serine protease